MLSRYDRAALFFGLESLEQRRMLTTASVSSTHVLNIAGTGGSDTITVNQISNGKVTVTGVSTQFSRGTGKGQFNQINITGSGGNDVITINNNVVYTSSTIAGGTGNDVLTGGKGNDLVSGNDGNDSLDGGGAGADVLTGGANFDTANYSYRTDNLTISLDGLANDGSGGGSEHDNVQTEEVIAGSGNDTLNGSGNDDFLAGGAGADVLNGNGGNDELIGSTGADKISGNDGDDFLEAKNQDTDTVSGGNNSNGSPDLDLADVDGIDVPPALNPVVHAAVLGPKSAAFVKPAITAPPPSHTADDFDPDYGDDGVAVGPDLGWESINAVAVDSQGRVVYVGTDTRGLNGEDMVVARFNADGTADTGFGYGGEADVNIDTTGFGYGTNDFAQGVTIGADDSIFVVGYTFTNSIIDHMRIAVAKLDNTGQLDESFNDTGTATMDLTSDQDDVFNGVGKDIIVQKDGSVVVAADRTRVTTQVTYDPAIAFSATDNPTGPWSYGYAPTLADSVTNYDTHTDTGGNNVWTSSQLKSASTLAPDVFQADTDPGDTLDLEPGFYGQFSNVVFTAPTAGFYDIDGAFDNDSESGATTDVHVLVNGVSQFDKAVTTSGAEGFTIDGVQLSAGDTVQFAVGYGDNQTFDNDTTSLQATVTRTSAPDDQNFAVARFTSTGQADSSFDFGQGWNSMDLGSDESVSSVALQNLSGDEGNQRIVVGGTADGNFAVARFVQDGGQDLGFGENGGYTETFLGDTSQLNDIAVDSANNIFAVGTLPGETSALASADSVGGSDSNTAIVAKFDLNGSFINSVEATGNSEGEFNGVAIDSMDRVVAAGGKDGHYLYERFNNNLTIDSTFSTSSEITLSNVFANGSSDTALGAGVLSDGEIIIAGLSATDGGLEASAIKLFGEPSQTTTENPFGVEQFIDDGDLKDPPPELQQHLDGLSPGAVQYIESAQTDDNGGVHIELGSKGDKVIFSTGTAADGTPQIIININGIDQYYNRDTTTLIDINTDGGPDTVVGDADIKTDTWIRGGTSDDSITGNGGVNVLWGGDGNDTLNGGNGSDVESGGPGKDKLFGNGKRDILIGGPSSDSISGGTDEDILIAGSTDYDADYNDQRLLLAEWNSTSSQTTRINHLRNGGGANGAITLKVTNPNRSVVDDSDIDTLNGNDGVDWYFRKKDGPKKDSVTSASGEVLENL